MFEYFFTIWINLKEREREKDIERERQTDRHRERKKNVCGPFQREVTLFSALETFLIEVLIMQRICCE